jgi:hypothetical protein
MSNKSDTNIPGTVNEAIKILAYNDWAWAINHTVNNNIDPQHKDKPTVTSLAESQYPWTEKQGQLAVAILKRYLTKFDTVGIDLRPLVQNPVFEEPFRVISSAKTIEVTQDKNGTEIIEMRFPYSKKVVDLIRCCKDRRGLPSGYFLFDGESKIWTIAKTDVTTYYTTLIAVRYDFTFVTEHLLDEYAEIKKEKTVFKKPSAVIADDKIILKNTNETLVNYWVENIINKKLLLQLDSLKQFSIPQRGLRVKSYSEVGKRIAHSPHTQLWIDKDGFNKDEVIIGLKELDCFPLIMPISGEVTNNKEDIDDFWDWIDCFERHGIDQHKNLSWGVELREPKLHKDKTEEERMFDFGDKLDLPTFDRAYNLYQLSKNFKHIDTNTKIYFIRNRIPRSFMRSNLNPVCSLIALGGGYYATGGENIKRLLDNLPKKLYYSNAMPLNYQWRDRAIIKL